MSRNIILGGWVNGGFAKLDLQQLMVSRMLLQAESGGGKSWALRKILEITSGQVQQIIIDPEGEFASLREQHDLVIVAATGGDALAHPKTAALLATRLRETQVSAVIDIYDLKPRDRELFVQLFIDAMVNAPKKLWTPAIIAIDEIHMFCDENEKALSTQSIIDLATRGRKRGLCLIAATQRISDFNKSAAAQLKNKLIGGTSLDVDVKRAAFELGKTPKEAMAMLGNLNPGEFYARGPALTKVIEILKIGDVDTSHPKIGERQSLTPPKPTAAILAILPKLADLPKEAEEEARTMATLQRDLATARRELAQAKREQPATPPIDPAAADRAYKEGFDAGVLQATPKAFNQGYASASAAIAGIVQGVVRAGDEFMVQLRAAQKAISESPKPQAPAPDTNAVRRPSYVPHKPGISRSIAPVKTPISTGAKLSADVSRPQQLILDKLNVLQHRGIYPASRATLAAFCRVSPSSSGYEKNLGTLKTLGLLEYPRQGEVGFTPDGLAAAADPDDDGTPAADFWISIVNEPKARILRALVDEHPSPMSRAAIAQAADVSAASSGFEKNLGQLKTLGAIDYPSSGMVGLTRYVMP